MNRIATADLATVHLAFSALALLWNLYMAGRIARMPGVPRAMGALAALAGLLIAPALFIAVTSTSLLWGRALHALAWLWPVTALLMTVQAAYAVTRGMAAVPLSAPILAYNALLTMVYGARFLAEGGVEIPDALLALSAAQVSALALGAHPMALLHSHFLHIPLLAPASPGRRGIGTLARAVAAAMAAIWMILILVKIPEGARAAASYVHFGREPLQERPEDALRIGLKILPTLRSSPPPLALQSDLAMVDTTGALVMSVYLAPRGASLGALEELAAGLEARRSGRTLIVALDLSGANRGARHDVTAYLRARTTDLDRITRVLRPDYVVPVLDPYGGAARRLGALPHEQWRDYITTARTVVRHVRPATRVMVHVGGYTASDSLLYAWAAGPEGPVDAVGLSLFPGYLGGSRLDARRSTASRWMRATPGTREHWILEAGGFPLAHGDANQALALWGALAWASSQPRVRGFVVHQASDYESPTGLRSPGGRIRPAARRVAEAVRMYEDGTVER